MKKLLLTLPLLAMIGVAVPATSRAADCAHGGNNISSDEKNDLIDAAVAIRRAADTQSINLRSIGYLQVASKLADIGTAAIQLNQRLRSGRIHTCSDVGDAFRDMRALLNDAVDQATFDGVPQADIDAFYNALNQKIEDLGSIAYFDIIINP